MKLMDKSDWASCTFMEAPYWRDGMTPAEYEVERFHFETSYDEYRKGSYKTLLEKSISGEEIDWEKIFRICNFLHGAEIEQLKNRYNIK